MPKTKTDFSKKYEEFMRIANDFGKKVIAKNLHAFRHGDTATIVGANWSEENERFVYTIQFDDGVTDTIPAGNLFLQSGYEFI